MTKRRRTFRNSSRTSTSVERRKKFTLISRVQLTPTMSSSSLTQSLTSSSRTTSSTSTSNTQDIEESFALTLNSISSTDSTSLQTQTWEILWRCRSKQRQTFRALNSISNIQELHVCVLCAFYAYNPKVYRY